ncbi:MAG TPA: DUF4391 domain-containing protein [Tepidisphaeraceae bacterium]|nr:DUF4391 domain-containing protein [Bryobacteraceae bacterium]HWB53394.1 DUF4391 domain-containing protein [Tepidisphaeraceae bacterium]
MFDFPKQAELNRVLPKSKIYEFAKPSRAVRDRFVRQVEEIVWKYKLAPETINIPARQGVEEIQVFAIALKARELTGTALRPVLMTIDKAIPSPIFYQLSFGDRVKFVAAYKRPSEAESSKSVVDTHYFETPWQSANAQFPPLPLALDLAGLYDQMLRHLIPFPPRPGESLRDHAERVNQIHAKAIECRRLEARLHRELQFNRKVEINAVLRGRQAELAQLQQI